LNSEELHRDARHFEARSRAARRPCIFSRWHLVESLGSCFFFPCSVQTNKELRSGFPPEPARRYFSPSTPTRAPVQSSRRNRRLAPWSRKKGNQSTQR